VLDIPVGSGRRFLANSGKLVNGLVGGWGLQGVTTLQSGFPLHFSTSQNLVNSFGGGSRPNINLADASTSGSAQSRLDNWFNQAAFSQPAPFTYGNEPRVDPNLRTAGIAQWDFSVFKRFAVGNQERMHFELRGEVFNAFNRVQFSPPGTTFGNSDFGVVTSQANLPRLIQVSGRFAF
jgi:hypothetical protein